MRDQDTPKESLLKELRELREKVNELETIEAQHKRDEEALRESERKYRFFVDNSKGIILFLNKRGKIIFANKWTLGVYGYSKEELIGKPITRFLTRDSLKTTLEALAQEFLGHPQPEIEVRAKTKSGEIRYLRVAAGSVPIYRKQRLIGVMISANDITEHKKAEEQLRESEERFRSVVEHSHEGIFIVDDAYRFIYCNDELSQILGYSREEIIGRDFRKFLDEESKQLVTDRYIRRQRGENIPPRYEFNIVRKDGKKRRVEISSAVIKDSVGKIRTVAQILDITERKRAEEALRESEEKYRTLTNNVNLGVYRNTVGLRGRFLEANPAIVKMFGHKSKEEFLAINVSDLYQNAEDRKQFNENILREEFVRNEELELKKKDGTPLIGSISAVAVKDEEGNVKFYDGIIEDITERKRAEKALQESERKLRLLAENMRDAVFIYDMNGRLQYVNPVVEKLTGYSMKEIHEQNFINYIHPEDEARMMKKWRELFKSKSFFNEEFRIVTKNGQIKWSSSSWGPILDEQKNQVGVLGREADITEQKVAIEALWESEEKFRNLAEKLPNMIFINKKGRVVYANEKCEEIMGYKREEIYSPDFDFFIMVAPEFQKLINANFTKHRKDEDILPLEYALLTKEGKRIEAILTTKLIDYGGEKAILGIVTDITESKKAARALEASEAELRALMAAMTDVILVFDMHGRYLKIPSTNPKLLYKPAPELIGETLHEVFPQAQADFFLGYIRLALETQQPVNHEYCLSIGGEEIWFSGTVSPMTEDTVIWVARDITNRKLAEKQLQASEAKYRGLLENVFDGVYQSTPEGKLLTANPAIVRMLGYESEEELLVINARDLYLNSEDRDIFARKIAEKGEVRNLELALKRKDGQSLIVLENARIMHNERGELYYEGTLTDISDLKRADEQIKASLAEKEILLREIHHRVKNNMQIISSLLNLQASQMNDKNVLKMSKESQSRIRSMALVHEKLYRSQDLSRINFSDYIRSLTTHLFQFNQVNPNLIQLKMDLEDVFLDIQTAIPCGLILNELITNALKHAFPKNGGGEITVELHPGGDHASQMVVRDDGVGIPEDMDIQDPKSFGLQIVTMLVNQLEGNMEVQRKGGTNFKIVFRELKYNSRF
jgi:PAS domain S-box-containing protein